MPTPVSRGPDQRSLSFIQMAFFLGTNRSHVARAHALLGQPGEGGRLHPTGRGGSRRNGCGRPCPAASGSRSSRGAQKPSDPGGKQKAGSGEGGGGFGSCSPICMEGRAGPCSGATTPFPAPVLLPRGTAKIQALMVRWGGGSGGKESCPKPHPPPLLCLERFGCLKYPGATAEARGFGFAEPPPRGGEQARATFPWATCPGRASQGERLPGHLPGARTSTSQGSRAPLPELVGGLLPSRAPPACTADPAGGLRRPRPSPKARSRSRRAPG